MPAPSFESVGAGAFRGGTTADTLSWLHTIAGNCAVMAVSFEVNQATLPVFTAKVGSATMTRLDSSVSYTGASGFFVWNVLLGLMNPPQGAQTVTISAAAAQEYWVANSFSYKDVQGFGTVVDLLGTANPAVMSVPSTAGQLVVQSYSGWTNSWTSYTQTQRFNSPNNPSASSVKALVVGDAPGAASLSFSASGSQMAWRGLAVPLLPVPPPAGAAGGAYTWAATPTGKRVPKSSGGGLFTWAATARGVKHPAGASSGGLTWVSSPAVGKRHPVSPAAGAFGWVGSADGHRLSSGASSGGYAWAGDARAGGTPRGFSDGAYGWHGSATGKRVAAGHAAGEYGWRYLPPLGISRARLAIVPAAPRLAVVAAAPKRLAAVPAAPRLSIVPDPTNRAVTVT